MSTRAMLIGIVYLTLGLMSPTPAAAADCMGLPADLVCDGGVCNGTAADDVIVGSNAADEINALGGNDVVCGRGGDDTIADGRGNDTIVGGMGHDDLHGNRGNDALYGNPGDDTLGGGRDDDVLIGGAGADLCDGGSGNDYHGLPSGLGTCEKEHGLEGTVTSVSPSTTDPAIDDSVGGDHLAYLNPAVPQRNELLVHLSGTGGTPSGNALFIQTVANQGMKAIGLQYVNDGDVAGVCRNE